MKKSKTQIPKKTVWPRIRDLPEAQRKPFGEWLTGKTLPLLPGVPRSEQDAYYPWDYGTWVFVSRRVRPPRLT